MDLVSSDSMLDMFVGQTNILLYLLPGGLANPEQTISSLGSYLTGTGYERGRGGGGRGYSHGRGRMGDRSRGGSRGGDQA